MPEVSYGVPCRVINGPRVASELGPLMPRQRTCGDYFSMSASCQQRKSSYLPKGLSGYTAPVCTENLIRVDDVMESPKLAE